MTSQPDEITAGEVIAGFSGTLPKVRQRPLYGMALFIVAVAMVLLPLIYLGIIAATAWAVVWHLKNDAGMIVGNGRSMLATLIIYLTPALIGGVLVLFM